MTHQSNVLQQTEWKGGFRIRGKDMTRLETFMDAAFAFATTMLVISVGEIPGNYPELIGALKEIPSFLSSFAIIMLFWQGHRTWSRRYGLEDSKTIGLSILLIFVLLVYIYPLRLMFSALFAWLTSGWIPPRFELQSRDELSGLFRIYGFGLTAMAGIMALLYLRAKTAAKLLDLTREEINRTNMEIASFAAVSFTGLASALYAWLMPPNLDLLAGFFYVFLPVIVPVIDRVYKRKERKLPVQEPQD